MNPRNALLRGSGMAMLLFASVVANACECIGPIDIDDMRAAKHVVVVRVTGTGVPRGSSPTFGIANVQVVDRLQGSTAPRRLRYSLGFCCPLRIEAGREYIVFMDATADTLPITMGNLVALPWLHGYDVERSGRRWREVLAGKRPLEAGHEALQFELLDAVSPPPQPP